MLIPMLRASLKMLDDPKNIDCVKAVLEEIIKDLETPTLTAGDNISNLEISLDPEAQKAKNELMD